MTKTKESLKLFVVKKYVWAKNAKDVLKQEKNQDAHECWIDEEWKRNNSSLQVGFNIEKQDVKKE